jgi:hypothetical protein
MEYFQSRRLAIEVTTVGRLGWVGVVNKGGEKQKKKKEAYYLHPNAKERAF